VCPNGKANASDRFQVKRNGTNVGSALDCDGSVDVTVTAAQQYTITDAGARATALANYGSSFGDGCTGTLAHFGDTSSCTLTNRGDTALCAVTNDDVAAPPPPPPPTGAPEIDLATTKADSPDPVSVGGLLTYTLTVTNTKGDTATNVVVTDALPSGVTLVSV